MQFRCSTSTSSTQTEIHTPLSADSSPSGPNVALLSPFPRPPCPFWHRNISQCPEQTPPNVGGLPQPQAFCHPNSSNHVKLSTMLETLRMGLSRLPCIAECYQPEGVREIARA